MEKADKSDIIADKGAALYSGGTDSTLAAYLLGRKVRHLTLLTFDPGFIFFIENSKRHAAKLKEVLGEDRVSHEILPIRPYIDRILFGNKKEDFSKYGFNLTALVCLGCRLSMHTGGIIHNLKNDIPVIVDGSIRKQSTIPEQLSSFISRNRHELWAKYGIRHYSPIYDEDHSDLKLDDLEISLKKKLKKQFIFFDTQPTCPFGVPADVYARLFYGDVSGHAREVDAFEYSKEKYPVVHRVIDDHFKQEGLDLAEMTDRLSSLSKGMPENWPGD